MVNPINPINFHLLDDGLRSAAIPYKNFSVDISQVENAFSRRSFAEIIENPEFFWLAFCKAMSEIEINDNSCFAISLQGHTLTISGREHIIKNIKNCVEEIRKLFGKGIKEKNSLIILPIHINDNTYIRENSELVDLTDWLNPTTHRSHAPWFKSFIIPAMQSFSESLGAIFSNLVVSIKYKNIEGLGIQQQNVDAFKIDWLPGHHFVYPIPAKTIPKRSENKLQESMYSMYKQKILCDWSLIAKNGVVKVHSVLLYTYGSEPIQKIFTSDLKESKEKTIDFSEFSLSTLKAFIDFIYLGEEGLKPESISKSGVDLSELLKIAHNYQIQTLIDCCTNLLTLFSSTDDKKTIKNLAELYNNEHLKKFYEYLFLEDALNRIGFIKV